MENIVTADFNTNEEKSQSSITLYVNGEKHFFETVNDMVMFLDDNNLSLHSDNITYF